MRKTLNHKHDCPAYTRSTSRNFYSSNNLNNLKSINASTQNQTHSAYLSDLNFHLIREITDSQTQKNYYRQKFNKQFHTHQTQLQIAFKTLGQKNSHIINLQQQIERMNKDFRLLNDQFVLVKENAKEQKQTFKKKMEIKDKEYQQKITNIQEESLKKLQNVVNKRVKQVQIQFQKRIQTYKKHIQQATQYSNQLNHQLKMIRQDYQQILLKNQTHIQESIHRELRKRDFQAQNVHLKDVAQYQTLKKANGQLKEQIVKKQSELQSYIEQNKRIRATNQVLETKFKDLQFAFNVQKSNNKIQIQQSMKKETQDLETNTQQNFVPVIFPVDTNLIGQIVSLRDFLIQKIIQNYESFFKVAAFKTHKKSASLIAFKNYLNEIKTNKQSNLLLYLHSGLQKIIKLYCPSMNYNKQYLTLKDQFIRKTLVQCQQIDDKQQKLFRLLELVHRLHYPINNIRGQISAGQLKLVQVKVLSALKKCFKNNLNQ